MSLWEVSAVVLALAYLVLAIREHIACWLAALISTGIYLVLMFRAGLYMESALQIFYIAMAVYGWYSWTHGSGPDHELNVSSWPPGRHILPLSLILLATLITGYLLTALHQRGHALPGFLYHLGGDGQHLDGGAQNHPELALLVRHRHGVGVPVYKPRPVPDRAVVRGLPGADRDRPEGMAEASRCRAGLSSALPWRIFRACANMAKGTQMARRPELHAALAHIPGLHEWRRHFDAAT